MLLWYFLKYRRTGRYIFALGGSEESARLSGIDVHNIKLLVYGLCGLLTAMGGVIWAARLSSGSPIGALNYELESIAAVIVGGGSLFGGLGSVERDPGGRAALRHDQQHPEPDGHLALLAGYDQRRADPDCGRPEPGAPPGNRPASPARCAGRREGMEGVNQRLSGLTFETRAVLKILAILLGMMALASVVSGGVFLQPGNLLNLVNQNAILTVVALGQLLVIITGGIDLSVGSTLAISSVLIVLFQDYGLFPAFVIALLAALVIGLTNGFLVTYVRLPAFVVTLAMLQIGSSIAKVLSGGGAVYTGYEGAGLPESLTEFYKGSVSGIPYPLVVCVLFIGLIAFYLRTSTGHFTFPVGGNLRAQPSSPACRSSASAWRFT